MSQAPGLSFSGQHFIALESAQRRYTMNDKQLDALTDELFDSNTFEGLRFNTAPAGVDEASWAKAKGRALYMLRLHEYK